MQERVEGGLGVGCCLYYVPRMASEVEAVQNRCWKLPRGLVFHMTVPILAVGAVKLEVLVDYMTLELLLHLGVDETPPGALSKIYHEKRKEAR